MSNLPAAGTADVFISYSHQNREVAARLADAIAAQGLRVWWDRDLVAGTEFAGVIETQLDAARVVLTLWSAESVRSAFVRDESARALRAGKLLPLRIEAVELPLGFGQTHTLDLIDWQGDPQAENLLHLLHELQQRRDGPLAATPGGAKRAGARPAQPRRLALIALALLLPIALAGAGKLLWDQRSRGADQLEAERRFSAGLAQQHAREPDLVSAQNAYLGALELRPGHGRARYYLGHVYAQRRLPADALSSFQLALVSTEAQLDNSQRRDATEQLQALTADPGEAAPLARSLAAAPAIEPAASAAPALPGGARLPPAVVLAAPLPRPPAATRPARGEPPAAVQARLAAEVGAIFGADKEQRISTTTRLVLDPEALSDAVPLALARAQALAARPSATLSEADASGIVNTLVLLQSALPGTFETHRGAIAQLIETTRRLGPTTRLQADRVAATLQAAAAQHPRAFVQIADEAQRPLALALAQRFRAAGYDAPPVELVGARAPERTELRVQGRSERGYARWIGKAVGEATESEPRVSTLRSARPQADTYEIWIARDLCMPGGRQVAACTGAAS